LASPFLYPQYPFLTLFYILLGLPFLYNLLQKEKAVGQQMEVASILSQISQSGL
jgi:hypothetical protein